MMGLLLPLLTILFSFFPKGIVMLTAKYESERKQSETNIVEEIKKRDSGKELDYQALKETLESLKQNKKRAETKLSLLTPSRMALRISIPLIISFGAVLVALQNVSTPVFLLAIIIIVLTFLDAVRVLWSSFQVLSEVARVVSESRESFESRLIILGKQEARYTSFDSQHRRFNGKEC